MRNRAVLIAMIFSALSATPAYAEISIRDAWVRATPANGKMTAGYATVVNVGASPDQLLTISAGAAAKIDLHQSVQENGLMAMRALRGLDIPASKSVELKPGGTHLMITGLSQPLVPGSTMELVFTFASAGQVKVMAKVAPLGASAPP